MTSRLSVSRVVFVSLAACASAGHVKSAHDAVRIALSISSRALFSRGIRRASTSGNCSGSSMGTSGIIDRYGDHRQPPGAARATGTYTRRLRSRDATSFLPQLGPCDICRKRDITSLDTSIARDSSRSVREFISRERCSLARQARGAHCRQSFRRGRRSKSGCRFRCT